MPATTSYHVFSSEHSPPNELINILSREGWKLVTVETQVTPYPTKPGYADRFHTTYTITMSRELAPPQHAYLFRFNETAQIDGVLYARTDSNGLSGKSTTWINLTTKAERIIDSEATLQPMPLYRRADLPM